MFDYLQPTVDICKMYRSPTSSRGRIFTGKPHQILRSRCFFALPDAPYVCGMISRKDCCARSRFCADCGYTSYYNASFQVRNFSTWIYMGIPNLCACMCAYCTHLIDSFGLFFGTSLKCYQIRTKKTAKAYHQFFIVFSRNNHPTKTFEASGTF